MPTALSKLTDKIDDRSAIVGVIGLGYVGLPLSLLYSNCGFTVIGFDTDDKKVTLLRKGQSYIRHIGTDRIREAIESGRMSAVSDFSRLAECDAILICVPTPLGTHREPDLQFVRSTADLVAKTLREGQLVVLESTTYPGTTREELLPRFEARGLTCGRDFFLAFSPEREDPGNPSFDTRTIPKVVGGLGDASRQAAVALYGAAVDRVVPVSSPEVAEASKLLENIFRSVNIAFVNEMKIVFDRMGIDVWEVIEAAKTKPFGYMPFYPGPGLGGHCIPLDPFYLSWKAAEHGVWARFVELAGEVNTSMPFYVVEKVAAALNEEGKCLNGASILVLGLSYKADIDDDRESPSFVVIEMLRQRGARVQYCDPHIPVARRTRKFDLDLISRPVTASEFGDHDVVLLLTPHSAFKDPELYALTRLLVDTRNVILPDALPAGRLRRA